jgi:hypothetical protein
MGTVVGQLRGYGFQGVTLGVDAKTGRWGQVDTNSVLMMMMMMMMSFIICSCRNKIKAELHIYPEEGHTIRGCLEGLALMI